MCAGKFLLMPMEGRAEGLAFSDPGARTPIGMSGIYFLKVYPHIIVQFIIKYWIYFIINCRTYFTKLVIFGNEVNLL